MFAFTVCAPVAIDAGGTDFGKAAFAKGGNGGGHGGGNGGGNGRGKAKSKNPQPSDSEGAEVVLPTLTEPTVAVAVFTTAIRKRHPADDIAVLDDPHQAISFFNELHAMTGKKITHRWMYGGAVKFTATFDVMSVRWRIWSTQLLPASLTGEWTVDVVDETGKVLESRQLIYLPKGVEHIASQ